MYDYIVIFVPRLIRRNKYNVRLITGKLVNITEFIYLHPSLLSQIHIEQILSIEAQIEDHRQENLPDTLPK